METRCTLVHLSDIHFRNKSYDLDKHLRGELLRDAEQMRGRVGSVSGILISGDIAFSGKSTEYDEAEKWLDDFCNGLKCERAAIWTIPGNHDINRSAQNMAVLDIHASLRAAKKERLDEQLHHRLSDDTCAALLFQPLADYNNFATPYECAVSAAQDKLSWLDYLKLNDGSFLGLKGITSTLVSNKFDSLDGYKLVVGEYQAQLNRKDDTCYLVMCHHPPDWLIDGTEVEGILGATAAIHLYGHKHQHVINFTNSTLRVSAGAVHPDRSESDWEPRYNYLSIWITNVDGKRLLNIDLFSRVWKKSNREFQADFDKNGKDYRHYEIQLPDWTAPATISPPPVEVVVSSSNSVLKQERDLAWETRMRAHRTLVYRFMKLSYADRIDILKRLSLFEQDDTALSEIELFKKAFAKASKQNLLESLAAAVECKRGN